MGGWMVCREGCAETETLREKNIGNLCKGRLLAGEPLPD